MIDYKSSPKFLIAVDSVVFGYDGFNLKILLIKRLFEKNKVKWSLMGGFIKQNESIEQAANRVLTELTGLDKIFLEQLYAFGNPKRDPYERTISVAYYAMLDLTKYKQQLSTTYEAAWFDVNKMPKLIFDHNEMVAAAKAKLQYKAAIHPILFELMPLKFTIPQLQGLFEQVYDTAFDKRNFSRKIMASNLLLKLTEKDKVNSKKGAFYYKLDKKHYKKNFHSIQHFIPISKEL